MGVPHHSRLRTSHAGPAFQRLVILVNDCSHHGANVERFLAPSVGVVREDLADSSEPGVRAGSVRIRLHIPVNGIACSRPPWESLARSQVGVLIMAQEDVAGLIDVSCPVLRLAVDSHNAIVPANSFVVLGGDAARVVQGALAGEYHRRFRGHDQNAAGVHQHGRLGVPVGLRPHVDPIDDEIHFAACLRKLDQAAQDAGDPVHVFHAALHRDLRPGRDWEPLKRHAHLIGEIQCGKDSPAFGFGECAQVPARISHQQHARHALGILGGKVADNSNDDVGFVLPVGTINRCQMAVRMKIVLDKIAVGKFGPRVFAIGRQHFDDFVGIDQSPPPHPDNFLVVLGQRFHQL